MLFLIFLTIFTWGHAGMFFKLGAEIAFLVKTDFISNIDNFIIRIQQHPDRVFHSDLIKIRGKGFTSFFFE